MGENQAPLSGPDLAAGVAADSVKAGEMLLGHANGDAILLTRDGNDFFAIGASCTHYGGPLAEGVLKDGVVHCPWHHACFSARTGEALKAPALNPLPCYVVERRGKMIVVGAKQERDPLSPTYPVQKKRRPDRVVVVGAGAAGNAAAEMLRRCGYDGSVTVIDEEPDSPYDRPNLSKDYLAGNAPEEWIPIRQPGFHEEHGITVIRGRAARIDLEKRQVEIENNAAAPFDALILATGAEPIRLGLPGENAPHVHYLRSLRDSRAIIADLNGKQRAVVIGASFIGLEVAASLRARGLDVSVVGPEKLPLERVLGSELGSFIKRLHEEHGVQFHLEHKPAGIEGDSVILDDGARLGADLVVIGVGVRPRLALAEQAGLKTDKGVLVNEFLETSAPGVYAAGDIARWPDVHSGAPVRVEHWVVAQRMGQTAARNVLGANERFDDVPFFWSAHYDVSINYVGHAEKWDRVLVDGDPDKRDVAVSYDLGGKRMAFASIFRDQESLGAELQMEADSEKKH
jgi:NADPH-dependent 2,4-dienoyl-CoA reductase/sulfur reductase-like enzyme/nitrite reductase/ring-hydroxylating ferredoxin subunit